MHVSVRLYLLRHRGEGRVGGHPRLERTVRVVHAHLDAKDQVEPVGLGLHIARGELGAGIGRSHDAAKGSPRKRIGSDSTCCPTRTSPRSRSKT